MILAIGHEAGVGKDTFAMLLIDYLRSKGMKGLNIVREGFATRLYELCHIMYGWAGFQTRQFYDQHPHYKDKVLEPLGKKPWEILEQISERLTEYDRNIFFNAVVKTKGPHLKIIPDLRRPLEFELLEKEPRAVIIRIAKTGYVSNRKFCQYLLPYGPRFHHTIFNDGTLGEFREKVIDFAELFVIPTLQKYLHGELKVAE